MEDETKTVLKLLAEDVQTSNEIIPFLLATQSALVRVLILKGLILPEELKVAEDRFNAKFTELMKEKDAQREEIRKQIDG